MFKIIFLKILLLGFFYSNSEDAKALTVNESSKQLAGQKNLNQGDRLAESIEEFLSAGEKFASQEKESANQEKKIADQKGKSISEQGTSSFDQENLNEIRMDESTISSDLPSYLPEAEKSKDIEAFWKSAFKLRAFSGRPTIDFTSGIEFYGKLRWKIVDFLSFYNEGLIIGRSGFIQSIYERVDRRSGLHLIESYFDLDTSFLTFRFGNIKQDFLEAPLLITDKTFSSLIQKLSFDLQDNVKLTIFLQEAITDNAVESIVREAQLNKWVPLFFTSSFFFDFNNVFDLNIKEKLTAFYMTNLSPAIAEGSLIYGNNIDYMESDSRFKYGFLGIYNSLNFQKILSNNWVIEIGGDIIYNFLASNTYNQGDRVYSSLYHNYEDFVELRLIGEYFANQSDTSVAYFNSELYGHNNREGFRLAFQSHFYSSGLTLGLSYTGSWPINEKGSAFKGFSSATAVFLKSNYVPI